MKKRFSLVISFLLISCIATLPLNAAKALWNAKLPSKATWHQLTDLGIVIVGTGSGITAYDPDNGEVLWTRNIKKSTKGSARVISGTPFLLGNNSTGLGATKVALEMINYLDGNVVWKKEMPMGQYMGAYPVLEKNLVIFVFNAFQEDDGQGVYFYGLDFQSGEQKWKIKYGKSNSIQLHVAEGTGKFAPRMDLSGYYDPVVEGDIAYLGIGGVHALDLNTGEFKWKVEFKPGDKGLKRTYAPIRIDGDALYGAGGGSVYAINKRSGEVIWKSDRISKYAGLMKARDNAIVSQVEPIGDKVFIRFGGNFSNGQTMVLKQPIGVAAFNKDSGEEIYRFAKPKEGLTNLMVLRDLNTVMFADAKFLYGLDAAGEGAVENFQVPIEFKRKMGTMSVAKMGLGALGGLQGLAKASVSQSKERLDVPVAIIRRGGEGNVIVQGKQHVMAFDPAGKQIAWSVYFAAPGNPLADAALFATAAFGAVAGNGMAAGHSYGSSGYNSGANVIHDNLDMFNKRAGQRAEATRSSEQHVYVLTNVKEGKKKGVGLVGIHLGNGEGDKQVILGAKDVDYEIDESINRIYAFEKGTKLIAYDL